MSELYLVTGATANTGRYALDDLLAAGKRVRAFVHKEDERADELRKLGAEVMVGDLLDLPAVREATKGVTAGYFVYPIRPGLIDATVYFAQAALEEGVKAIVNMSQISSRPDSKSNAARDHWVCERLFDRSGVPVVHLRPTFFSQWLLYHGRARKIAKTGIIQLPFGEARHAPISAEDQGRVIASILRDPAPHVGKTYPLFGAVEMDYHQIAREVGKVIGRDVNYVPMSIPEFRTAFDGNPHMPPHLLQHLCEVAQDYQDGIFSGMNDVVETVTGKRPLTVNEFVTLHRGEFSA